MADGVKVTITLTYPLGSPESYGGETDPDKQIDLERTYIEDEGDYVFTLMSLSEIKSEVVTVERVKV